MKYDVVIIGGGPAGIMAAGRAGELGARVLLLEKNERLGKKLLITGGGRCNITNNIIDPKLIAANFGPTGKFLISAFNKFGVKEIIDFFNNRGVTTKIEKDNQVFPISNRSAEVLQALTAYLKEGQAEIKLSAEVKKIITDKNKITKVILTSGQKIEADKFIIATGGKSYSITGSTGDAYAWLKKLGHTIIPPRPALVPIILKEKFIKKLEGLSLSQIQITLFNEQKKIISLNGDAIFTARGLSGPAILNLSRYINEKSISSDINSKASAANFSLSIDLFPEINREELTKKLQSLLTKNGNKLFRNVLGNLVPLKMADLLNELAKISPNKKANAINKDDQNKIIELLKSFELEIDCLDNYDKAIITAGGVDLKEIDPKTMRSKIISNLFLAGEILDLDGPTGGFNLQVCWSTGYVAGENTA